MGLNNFAFFEFVMTVGLKRMVNNPLTCFLIIKLDNQLVDAAWWTENAGTAW